jgi:hypothetical protein
MSWAVWTAVLALALGGLAWTRVAWGTWRLRELPALGKPGEPAPAAWPSLSVVIAARDEANTIEPALASLLAQDYPALDIVLVDDRSSDGTGDVMERLARDDARVTVFHVRQLPAGWLGKVHALDCGLRASRGDFVLFTDADVHFAPRAMQEAVSFAVARRLDHLAAIPRFARVGGLVDLPVANGLRALITVVLPPWRVNRPASQAFFGVGAFNMVRREAFARSDGFDFLRMETADDVGVGLLLRRAGATCGVASALDLVRVTWQRSLGDLMRAGDKGYAAIGNCSAARMLLLAVVAAWFDAAPLVGAAEAAFGTHAGIRIAGGLVVLSFGIASLMFWRFMSGFLLASLLTPLAVPLTVATFVRATWRGWWHGGVEWRGTRYSSADLRAGRRVRLPF